MRILLRIDIKAPRPDENLARLVDTLLEVLEIPLAERASLAARISGAEGVELFEKPLARFGFPYSIAITTRFPDRDYVGLLG